MYDKIHYKLKKKLGKKKLETDTQEESHVKITVLFFFF